MQISIDQTTSGQPYGASLDLDPEATETIGFSLDIEPEQKASEAHCLVMTVQGGDRTIGVIQLSIEDAKAFRDTLDMVLAATAS